MRSCVPFCQVPFLLWERPNRCYLLCIYDYILLKVIKFFAVNVWKVGKLKHEQSNSKSNCRAPVIVLFLESVLYEKVCVTECCNMAIIFVAYYTMVYCYICWCCWMIILQCSGLLWHLEIRQIVMPTLYMLAIRASLVQHLRSRGKDEWIVRSNRLKEMYSSVTFLAPEVLERRHCYNHSLEGVWCVSYWLSHRYSCHIFFFIWSSLIHLVLVTGNLLMLCHLTVNALQQILLNCLMYVFCWHWYIFKSDFSILIPCVLVNISVETSPSTVI